MKYGYTFRESLCIIISIAFDLMEFGIYENEVRSIVQNQLYKTIV